MKTALFDFDLPPELIATQPISPRDASKLLRITSDGLSDRKVRDLPELLRPGDVMVFNDTKVIPAQLTGKRGEVAIEITLNRYLGGRSWHAFARPGKRLKIGDKILFNSQFSAEVKHKHDDGGIALEWNDNSFMQYIDKYGELPLPHYMKRPAQHADKQSYQTIYAQNSGAVAAPPAGLHFTKELLKAIDNKGIIRTHITLHVGAGTFQPVKVDDTKSHHMHSEYFSISSEIAEVINAARKEGRRIVAVGTTSLRALESAADENGHIRASSGDTRIFITPGYKFKVVDKLMTNFHLPRSTLFMLVSAFSGLDRMKEAYAHAIEEGYRFYSYGDACLLER